MTLAELLPTADAVDALEPEELAGYVLEFLYGQGQDSFSPSDLCLEHHLRHFESHRRQNCARALMEALGVLEAEGFVSRHPDRAQYGVLTLTRRGRKTRSRSDYNAFRQASLLPKESLHPVILEKVYSLFLRGEYETAVFQAYRTIEVTIRTACSNLDAKLYGVDLIRQAFHPETGPLTNNAESKPEREALQALFAGAIGRFKNPASHRHVPIASATEAVELLQFASHLHRVLDDRI